MRPHIGEANGDEGYQQGYQRHTRSGIGTYILAQDLTCTCVLMLMRWCNHDAYGMVQ
jgi:hypothetical protein